MRRGVVMMRPASDSETSRLDWIAGTIGPRMAPAITVSVAETRITHSLARVSENFGIKPYSSSDLQHGSDLLVSNRKRRSCQ